jgi:hypothetical protein
MNSDHDQTELFDITEWKLDDRPRFPTTPGGWDNFTPAINAEEIKTTGAHAYDLLANPYARQPQLARLATAFRTFREDFDKVSKAIAPEGWRLLFYLDQFDLHALGQSGFDSVAALRELCNGTNYIPEVPSECLGIACTADDVAGSTYVACCQLSPDLAKAAWVILGIACRIKLEKNEVLQVPWWEPWWIERYLNAVVH